MSLYSDIILQRLCDLAMRNKQLMPYRERVIGAAYYVMWSGQYEYLERATARLKTVIPVTLLIIFLLLYLNFRSITETLIVMLSLPFALVGGLWLM
jgi:Cu/Ag efflux pump CusA